MEGGMDPTNTRMDPTNTDRPHKHRWTPQTQTQTTQRDQQTLSKVGVLKLSRSSRRFFLRSCAACFLARAIRQSDTHALLLARLTSFTPRISPKILSSRSFMLMRRDCAATCEAGAGPVANALAGMAGTAAPAAAVGESFLFGGHLDLLLQVQRHWRQGRRGQGKLGPGQRHGWGHLDLHLRRLRCRLLHHHLVVCTGAAARIAQMHTTTTVNHKCCHHRSA